MVTFISASWKGASESIVPTRKYNPECVFFKIRPMDQPPSLPLSGTCASNMKQRTSLSSISTGLPSTISNCIRFLISDSDARCSKYAPSSRFSVPGITFLAFKNTTGALMVMKAIVTFPKFRMYLHPLKSNELPSFLLGSLVEGDVSSGRILDAIARLYNLDRCPGFFAVGGCRRHWLI